MSNYWKQGSWNCICDRCGQKKKADQVKQDWQGFIVCNECYETRHPMDFIRTRIDKQTVPFSRPYGTNTYITVSYTGNTLTCTPLGSSAVPGFAIPGCSVPGKFINGLL